MSLSPTNGSAPSSTTSQTTTTIHNTSIMQNWVTRTQAFQKLTLWAFRVCDADGSGKIGKTELYAGILLVHLQLAKYMGAAACYPPTKEVIDQLYEASDTDRSGSIDEEEFKKIMVICCAQIASRIVVYFAILVLLAKYAATVIMETLLSVDDVFGCKSTPSATKCVMIEYFESAMTWGELAETTISLILFFVVVPMIFNFIDRSSKKAAECADAIKEFKAS